MLHRKEQAIDDYVKRELHSEVKKIVSEQILWIAVGASVVFIIYIFLAIWMGFTTNDLKQDTIDANNFKRQIALQELNRMLETDSLERIKIQEERAVIASERATDSMKRAKTDSLVKKYDNTVREWKNLK